MHCWNVDSYKLLNNSGSNLLCFFSDRQIRHRACALKDTVHAIIQEELDEDFEKICDEIKESRKRRRVFLCVCVCASYNCFVTPLTHLWVFFSLTFPGCSTAQFAPTFYHVLPKQPNAAGDAKNTSVVQKSDTVGSTAAVAASTSFSACSTPKNTGNQLS